MTSRARATGTSISATSTDRTDKVDFLHEHGDRIMAWDVIHMVLCAGKTLSAQQIVERTGLPYRTVCGIMKRIRR